MIGLANRNRQPELMDQPDLAEELHDHALRGLRRINRISGSGRIVWDAIRTQAQESTNRPLRVLDLACGSGDVAVDVAGRAARERLPVEVDGADVSEVARRSAEQLAERNGVRGVRFFLLDALHDSLPAGYDVVMCSLFLHHLDEHDAVELLRRMAGAAGRAVLVNDLRRTTLGFAIAYVGTRILTRSPIVHFDGPVSVKGAWTCDEVRGLAARAGLAGAIVARRFPERFLLSWTRS